MRVLVTGAGGFVGGVLCRHLAAIGHGVRGQVRRAGGPVVPGVEPVVTGDIADPAMDWSAGLAGVEAVVHLAARVHVLQERAADPAAAFHAANVAATERLALAAARAGARRFVFVSSVKVNGEGRDAPYRPGDVPAPEDDYGRSKAEAEVRLRAIGAAQGMEVVVVRPPLVYGPGVGGNFLRLMALVGRGVPLPFGAVHNRRSLVGVDNLASALAAALLHPAAAGRTYLVADGEDVSTPGLVRGIAAAMGRPARLVPVPPALMQWAARLAGREAAAARLLGSLTVDATALRTELGWTPPRTLQAGLADTAAWFRAAR